ncbi:toll/interleukin-1 receptor-like protein [Cryptomeria japonica]|uniref:toll/interleukin-1 receptor-like protein n=1 Tax=Cryptomeria japonica TaxID=3369 RepID=UPI0027D9EEDA|nr:toll/interleukin-1 receptor-like protein [Cryptomeria japonica]
MLMKIRVCLKMLCRKCDVFINHRGLDVKHKLASNIYFALDAIGLRPFLDVEVLEPGVAIPSTIQEAMTSASLHISILSHNYAQSSRCLDELSFMLRTGTKTIPIFYHVEPSDAQWVIQGKGIYADAFSEHEKKGRFGSEKIEEWKRALHDISFLSGHVVNDDIAEGRLLKSICNEALQTRDGFPVKIARFLIRTDEHMSRLLADTDEESENSEQDVEESASECSDDILSSMVDRVRGSVSACLNRVEVSVNACLDRVEGSVAKCVDRAEGSVNVYLDKVEQSGDEPIDELIERGMKRAFIWFTED